MFECCMPLDLVGDSFPTLANGLEGRVLRPAEGDRIRSSEGCLVSKLDLAIQSLPAVYNVTGLLDARRHQYGNFASRSVLRPGAAHRLRLHASADSSWQEKSRAGVLKTSDKQTKSPATAAHCAKTNQDMGSRGPKHRTLHAALPRLPHASHRRA